MNAATAVCVLAVIAMTAFAAWRVGRTLRSGRCCEGGCRGCGRCRCNVSFEEKKE